MKRSAFSGQRSAISQGASHPNLDVVAQMLARFEAWKKEEADQAKQAQAFKTVRMKRVAKRRVVSMSVKGVQG